MPGTKIYVNGQSLFNVGYEVNYLKIEGGEIVLGQNAQGILGEEYTPNFYVLNDVAITPQQTSQWDTVIQKATTCTNVYNTFSQQLRT